MKIYIVYKPNDWSPDFGNIHPIKSYLFGAFK